MVDLEQMREKYQLQDRVELLGSIKPADVRNVSPSPLSPPNAPADLNETRSLPAARST